MIQRDHGQLDALARRTGDHDSRSRFGAAVGSARRGCAGALRAGARRLAASPRTRMRRRSRRGSARPRSSARESSSWRISSGGCCSSRSARRRSARRSRSCSRPCRLETLAEQATLAREAGQRAAAELAEVLAAAVRRPRARARADPGRSTRCARAGNRPSARRCRPRRCSRPRSARRPARSTQWLKAHSLDQQPRVAQQLRVERGWERAVETVLGSYLEAVCVDGLDAVAELLGELRRRPFGGGERRAGEGAGAADRRRRLQAKVRGAAVSGLHALLGVHRRDPGRGAARCRRRLTAGQSVVTRDGIWLGAGLAAPVARPRAAHGRHRARGVAAHAARRA